MRCLVAMRAICSLVSKVNDSRAASASGVLRLIRARSAASRAAGLVKESAPVRKVMRSIFLRGMVLSQRMRWSCWVGVREGEIFSGVMEQGKRVSRRWRRLRTVGWRVRWMELRIEMRCSVRASLAIRSISCGARWLRVSQGSAEPAMS